MTAQRAKPKKQPTKVRIRRPRPGSKSETIATLAVTTPATNAAIAKKVDCHPSLVQQVLDRYGLERNTIESFKKHKADVLAGMQDKLLNSLDADTIKAMPAGQRLMGFGILYDKERLERQLSTVIVGYDADSFAERVAALRQAIREADVIDAEETDSNNDMPNNGQAERSTTKLLE